MVLEGRRAAQKQQLLVSFELSSHDSRVLMGVPEDSGHSPPPRTDSLYSGGVLPLAPTRPSREMRRPNTAAMAHYDIRS